jgi:hypothetical protein
MVHCPGGVDVCVCMCVSQVSGSFTHALELI